MLVLVRRRVRGRVSCDLFGDEKEFGEELVERIEMEEVLRGKGVIEGLVVKLPFGLIGGGVGEELAGDELGEREKV